MGHDDSLIDALVAMRPEQTDPVAHLLRAKVRRDLVDATDDPFRLGRFTVLGRLGGGGGVNMCCVSSPIGLSESNGTSPVAISYSKIPRE